MRPLTIPRVLALLALIFIILSFFVSGAPLVQVAVLLLSLALLV